MGTKANDICTQRESAKTKPVMCLYRIFPRFVVLRNKWLSCLLNTNLQIYIKKDIVQLMVFLLLLLLFLFVCFFYEENSNCFSHIRSCSCLLKFLKFVWKSQIWFLFWIVYVSQTEIPKNTEKFLQNYDLDQVDSSAILSDVSLE